MNYDMNIKNIKNMQSNGYIFKICSHINFFRGSLFSKYVAKFFPFILT